MADRILIKNGIVLTQDPNLGELPRADVLIDGTTIEAVGPNLSADGAKVIDAAGDIVIPGFIDSHRHTWETSIRTCAPDYALVTYFGSILDKFGPHYRPDDVLAANRWGALECINAGITTLVDWSHIMNTPAHADAAIRGLQESRIRSVFAYGFGNTSLQDWWFGPDWTGSVLTCGRRRRASHPEAVLQLRRRSDHDVARDPRPGVLPAGRRPPRLGAGEGARDQHHGPRRDGPVRGDEDADRQAPRHGPAVPEHHLRPRLALHRRGVGARAGFRRQRLVRAPDRGPDGPRLGAGLDRDPVRPADRAVLGRRDHGAVRPVHPDALDLRLGARPQAPEAWDADLDGLEASPGLITSRQVLEWATLGGAKVAGIADRTGSITPGKKADIVIIDGSAVNVAPIIDPVGAVVCAADVSNVKTVLVDGEILKQDFKLAASLGGPRRVEASRDYLLSKFGDPEPGWLPAKAMA